MAIRVALCAMLIVSAAPAQWKRYVHTLEGGGNDSPPPHDLRYFRADPCLRGDKNDRVTKCGDEPSGADLEQRSKTRTNLRLVGKIGAFTIYDMEYLFDLDYPGPHMRSVLVETPRHEVHEIIVQEKVPNGTLFPSKILPAGRQRVLSVRFDSGGMHHDVAEDLFVVLPSGEVLLDLKPVIQAAREAVPRGMEIDPRSSYCDLKALVFRGTTGPDSMVSPYCEGHVEVPFRIEHGRVLAGKAAYYPQ